MALVPSCDRSSICTLMERAKLPLELSRLLSMSIGLMATVQPAHVARRTLMACLGSIQVDIGPDSDVYMDQMKAFIEAAQGKEADIRSSFSSAAKTYELTKMIQIAANKHRAPACNLRRGKPNGALEPETPTANEP